MDEKVFKKLKEGCEPLIKKYPFIKAVWVFGSAARAEAKPHDVDLMMIIDDTEEEISEVAYSSLKDDLDKLGERLEKESGVENVSFQSPKPLSLWWDMLRSGSPWAFTSMRDALTLYDPAGYVEPIKILLQKGRIAGTHEQAEELIGRAPLKLEQARKVFLEDITADLMMAMTEAAQAVLMFAGIVPPAAKNVRSELRSHFVRLGLLEESYVRDYEDFFEIARKIEHGETTKFSGEELDKWLGIAVTFIERMEKLFVMLDVMKRKSIVEEANKIAFAAATNALRQVGEIPSTKAEKVIENFKRHFIDTGLVAKEHLNILQKIYATKKALEAGKFMEVAEKDVYESEVYAKNLAMVLEQTLKAKVISSG